MARVTVEDCIEKIENRFDLVLMAAHRARMISAGAQITVDRDNDKNPVVSLREIGDGAISPEDLREDLIHSLQKYVEVDEPERHAAPLLDADADPMATPSTPSAKTNCCAASKAWRRPSAATIDPRPRSAYSTGAPDFSGAFLFGRKARPPAESGTA